MKLSVIVPVYKVERSLDACVMSILNQNLEDFELLLVDDGSPDNCGRMCDEWAQKDRRIRVFHKENGGLSDARNFGISNAEGEYITFVDSDDELAPGTLAYMIELLDRNEEADVVEYTVHVHAGSDDSAILSLPDRLWTSPRQYWHETMAWEHCYAWNKVYRRKVVSPALFPKGRLFEDAWTWPRMLAAKHDGSPMCVLTTSHGLYIYKWNSCGITVTANRSATWQLFTALVSAAWLMHTNPFSSTGRLHYRSILCRIIDLIRL